MNDLERLKICQLLLKKIEGTLSPEENIAIYEALETNQEALDIYLDFAFLHSNLIKPGETTFEPSRIQDIASDQLDNLLLELSQAERDAEPVIIDTSPHLEKAPILETNRVQQSRKLSKSSVISIALSAAAILMVALYIHFVPIKIDASLGILSRTVNARWLDSSGHITDGCDLYAGPLHLMQGYAEIYTHDGTQLVLQAPVELDLESDSQLLLRKGNITVKVDSAEGHYIVRTPTASVVDFGTEFGVCVNDSSQTLTHVYEGQVELRSGSNPLRTDQVLKLTKGQSAEADERGRLSERNKISNLFVRGEEFNIQYTAVEGSRYQQWLAYSYALRRDPALVLYYPFLKSDESWNFIANCAINTTDEKLNGMFGGTFGTSNFTQPTWTTGRWKEKAALQFDRDQRNCVAVAKNAALNLGGDITLAVWVRCPEPQKGGHILSNRLNKAVNYQFGCFSVEDPYFPGQLQFLKTRESASLVYSSKRFKWTSEWTFLAVTHDKRIVRFYVNGRLFESIPFVTNWQPVSVDLFIGDVPTIDDSTFEYAAFNGLIDEIAIFKRALSIEEIQRMYQTGKP